MKIKLEENKDQFWLELQPESIAEAAKLARLGLNNKKRGLEIYVCVNAESITGSVVISKPKNEKSYITPR